MSNQEIAIKYQPVFMADEKEPFEIQAIGYTIFKEDGKSRSCKREYHIEQDRCQYMIEYAVFFDFDIQHLYDLEHVFVYVGLEGEVIDVEASFHGKFLRSMINGVLMFQDITHPVIYMQPGKHAMMPDPSYFRLFIGMKEACMEYAGIDGVLIPPMLEDRLETSTELDRKVEQYIKDRYVFCPSEKYRAVEITSDSIVTYDTLEEIMAHHIENWMRKIEECETCNLMP